MSAVFNINKLLGAKIILLSVSMFSLGVQAAQFGTIAVAGNACYGSTDLQPILDQTDRYEAPIRLKVYKKASLAFDRKTCNFRLPISVKAGEKIQVLDVSHDVRLSASKGSMAKSSLEVGLTSKKNEVKLTEVIAEDKLTSVKQTILQDGIVAESNCGQDVIVSGNLSLITQGQNKALGSVQNVVLTIKVVACE